MPALVPDDIKSITVIKGAEAAALWGSRGANGVIIIITKDIVLQLKNIYTHEPIPKATISIQEGDSVFLTTVADDSGRIKIPGLVTGKQYSIKASAVGFEKYDQHITFSPGEKLKEIFLEREMVECLPVFLKAKTTIAKRHLKGCGGTLYCRTSGLLIEDVKEGKTSQSIAQKNVIARLFPNPATAGSIITIEFTIEEKLPMVLVVADAKGSLINKFNVSSTFGKNHFSFTADSRLAAGFYFLNLTTSTGNTVASQKLIIQ
jgi:TonB-dependent SusC/RagA subfamily outer membrane receptor